MSADSLLDGEVSGPARPGPEMARGSGEHGPAAATARSRLPGRVLVSRTVRPAVSARVWVRAPVLVSVVAVAATAAVVTVSRHPLSATTSFLPAVLSVVACFDLLSVYLLAGEYRDTGDPRMLAMCAAYLWSLVLMAGYGLAFPGVFGTHPPLASSAQVAPWLYIGWHAGFPILLGAAWMPWPQAMSVTTEPGRRTAVSRAALTGVTAAAAAVVAACTLFDRQLPVIIQGLNTTRMTDLTAPVTLPLVLLALVAAWTGTRNRTGPETWSAVAVLVCLCDLVLTYAARHRFSVGWYAGRALTVTAAGVVLFAMLAGFRRLKNHAEINAAYDGLTGLANRRSTHDTLDRLLSASRRAGRPLSVVSLDLDLFKEVNDRYGHATGDELLTAVGAALDAAVRSGDLVGRVGGEEFLALLPDTGVRGALLVAQRMHRAVARIPVGSGGGFASASFGVACLDDGDPTSGDLLRRADEALYRAKAAGRDRVFLAPAAPAGVA
jgi:diguanylate cyclase (GGDEF)-like protein